MNTEKTKTCIIGVSGYGRIHYDLLMEARAAGNVEIVGATIINPEEEAGKCARLRELGCRIFGDYPTMLRVLAGNAELCMIPTGIPMHREMTVAALEAGMHVLVEKPAAGCIEDVRAMQEAARKAGRIVAVGYQQLYASPAVATKKLILDGVIGTVKSIKALVLWPRDHAYYGRNGWAGKLRVNGSIVNDSPFNNAVAHDLMMMLFQAGKSARDAAMPVGVTAELYRANAIESADTGCVLIETAEGIPIRFYATHACREAFGPEVHIQGSQGRVVMTHEGAVITPEHGDPIHLASGGSITARRAMMKPILDAVNGGSSFICDLELASRQTMVVSAMHEQCVIQTLDGETVRRGSGTFSTVVPGIERIMRQAFEAERMLGEIGLGRAFVAGD